MSRRRRGRLGGRRVREPARAAVHAAATPPTTDGPTLDFTPTAAADLPPGLADHPRYRVLRPLGSGGMGAVWLAEQRALDRTVALKVIHPAFLAHPGAVARFRREAQAVAKLHHPNIVAAYDADEAGGTHFLAMEYVPGDNLAAKVRADGPLPPAEACRAARDVALALSAAHAVGMVHRDIKPHNLIRTPDGVTKVLDFGLVAVAAGDGELTGGNTVVGTPDYIAPEQAGDARTADGRSDLYALGNTLYHLLAGQPPYPTDTVLQKIDAQRERPLPAVPGLPAGLAAVLAKLTAKRPADRYATASDAAAALEPFCRDAIALPPRRALVAVGGFAAIVAALAFGVVIVRDKAGREVARVETRDGDTVEVKSAATPPAPVLPAEPTPITIQAVIPDQYVHAVSPDGRYVLTFIDEPYESSLWDATTGKLIHQVAGCGHGTPGFTPDGRSYFVMDPERRRPKRIDTATGDATAFTPAPVVLRHLRLSPDGRWVVGFGGDRAHFWDAAEPTTTRSRRSPRTAVASA